MSQDSSTRPTLKNVRDFFQSEVKPFRKILPDEVWRVCDAHMAAIHKLLIAEYGDTVRTAHPSDLSLSDVAVGVFEDLRGEVERWKRSLSSSKGSRQE